jgi:hypothetical protein
MDDETLENLRLAYGRLAIGDVEAMTPVLDADVHWRGRASGLLRRRHTY